MTRDNTGLSHAEHSHSAELLSAAGLTLTALGIAGVVLHEHRKQQSQQDLQGANFGNPDIVETYRRRTAILNDERFTKRTRQLADLNRLAALVLVGHKPSRQQLRAGMPDKKDTAFVSILSQLTAGSGLVESVQDETTRKYFFAPTDALRWAARQPEAFPYLAVAVEKLVQTPVVEL